jgi:hypothetical protein
MKTTLNKIREHSLCEDGWEMLLRHLGKTKADDEELSLLTVLESNELDDAIWCLQAVDDCDRDARLFAVWCAREVQHLMTEQRSIDAVDVAERYADGLATEEELSAVRSAACEAFKEAAWGAAKYVAWSAASSAAGDAAEAARGAAWGAAEYAAWSATWSATWSAQKDMFIKMCKGEAPWQVEVE